MIILMWQQEKAGSRAMIIRIPEIVKSPAQVVYAITPDPAPHQRILYCDILEVAMVAFFVAKRDFGSAPRKL